MFAAASALLLLAPLLAVIALAIKLEDGGSVLYSHQRVGRNFRKFALLKFRSMVPNADRIGGPVTVGGDPRVTRVGGLLRKYKLDELPQLINVLRGDVQVVGARPEVERYVQMFRPQYEVILRDRPGLTDPATLAYRDEEQMFGEGDVEEQYVSRILPGKLELSLEHAKHRTLLSDLSIIFRTAWRIIWVWPEAQHQKPAAGG
jgi:lipopolysaccharide/colanic/teichoic acid biosynthesis glycosyltransferase